MLHFVQTSTWFVSTVTAKETPNVNSNTSPIVGSVVGVGLFVGVAVIILAVVLW